MTTTHRSAQFALSPATPPFATALTRYGVGGEWEDTDALFSPSVLSLYPDVSPFPGAEAYGVGYGTLCAVDPSGRQLASWEEGTWVVTP